MAKQILEGLWDCPYCKTTAIGGLTKHCPCCGHPQDTDTKFYMGTAKKYLDEDLAKQYGQGGDWVCPYCGSLNRVNFQYCSNCAAPKEEAKEDYFSKPEPAPEPEKETSFQQKQTPQQKPKGLRRFLPLLIPLAILIALIVAFLPKNVDCQVSAKEWSRSVDIEALRTVQESAWDVPDGAEVYDTRTEIHHYQPVFDHYEKRSRQVSERVYDGEDTHTSYSDNGDGTFTEETYTTPRYRTEYHTEYYDEPIYRNEPVFAPKYYYNIDRWMTDRTEDSSGGDDEPLWPELNLAENEREGTRRESYRLTVTDNKKGKEYTVGLRQEQWEQFQTGDAVKITVVQGRITKINDVSIQ